MQEKLKEQMINEIAKNYARYLVNYGVDITRTWETVTQNAFALDQAYIRGRQDERDKFDKWREEHGNDGWIPCSERLPEEDEYVLCSLNEDNPTIIHTIIIAKYDGCSYWHNGTVVAWQPLPQPYVKEK